MWCTYKMGLTDVQACPLKEILYGNVGRWLYLLDRTLRGVSGYEIWDVNVCLKARKSRIPEKDLQGRGLLGVDG